jgi:hypothetical protein
MAWHGLSITENPSASEKMRTASLLETTSIFDPLETTVYEDRPRSLYLAVRYYELHDVFDINSGACTRNSIHGVSDRIIGIQHPELEFHFGG